MKQIIQLFLHIILFHLMTTPLKAGCVSSGHENGVPQCEAEDYAITQYSLDIEQFKRFNTVGSQQGAVWASDERKGYLAYGPYLRFDYPGDILVKFYFEAKTKSEFHMYKFGQYPCPGFDRDEFALDLVAAESKQLAKRTFNLREFEAYWAEHPEEGGLRFHYKFHEGIGLSPEGSHVHLSTSIQKPISNFEARVYINSECLDMTLQKIVIIYTRY